MLYRNLLAVSQLTRLYMSIVIGITALCGVILSGGNLYMWQLICVFLSEVATASAGFALNDIQDLDRDVGASFKPLPSKRISLRTSKQLVFVLVVVALVSILPLGILPSLLIAGQLFVLARYSSLKRKSAITANLVTALLCSSSFLLGSIVLGSLGRAWIPALVTFLFIVAREIVKDVMDLERDLNSNVRTLPAVYGLQVTSVIVTVFVFLALAAALLPVVQSQFAAIYSTLMYGVAGLLAFSTLAFVLRRSTGAASVFLRVTAGLFPVVLLAFLLGS